VLAELDISGCPQLSSAALPALARGLQVRQSGLRVLRLAGCTFAECLDDCTLAAVLFAAPQLQVLDITGARFVSNGTACSSCGRALFRQQSAAVLS
jgi:hypothetical protein